MLVQPSVPSWNLMFLAITQPKVTDLDCHFWLAPMPLYVSRVRERLNFGSASIRLDFRVRSIHNLEEF